MARDEAAHENAAKENAVQDKAAGILSVEEKVEAANETAAHGRVVVARYSLIQEVKAILARPYDEAYPLMQDLIVQVGPADFFSDWLYSSTNIGCGYITIAMAKKIADFVPNGMTIGSYFAGPGVNADLLESFGCDISQSDINPQSSEVYYCDARDSVKSGHNCILFEFPPKNEVPREVLEIALENEGDDFLELVVFIQDELDPVRDFHNCGDDDWFELIYKHFDIIAPELGTHAPHIMGRLNPWFNTNVWLGRRKPPPMQTATLYTDGVGTYKGRVTIMFPHLVGCLAFVHVGHDKCVYTHHISGTHLACLLNARRRAMEMKLHHGRIEVKAAEDYKNAIDEFRRDHPGVSWMCGPNMDGLAQVAYKIKDANMVVTDKGPVTATFNTVKRCWHWTKD